MTSEELLKEVDKGMKRLEETYALGGPFRAAVDIVFHQLGGISGIRKKIAMITEEPILPHHFSHTGDGKGHD